MRLARTTRFYPTGQGHVEVQEMEARVKFLGRHYAYWCVQVVMYYQADPPSDTSDVWSESDLDSLQSDETRSSKRILWNFRRLLVGHLCAEVSWKSDGSWLCSRANVSDADA